MFDGLGIQWAATLLGCLAACLVPIPICFYIFGKRLRAKSKFAPTMTAKEDRGEETSDDEHQMPALQATTSRAHHDPLTNNRSLVDGDVEKNASKNE